MKKNKIPIEEIKTQAELMEMQINMSSSDSSDDQDDEGLFDLTKVQNKLKKKFGD